MNGQPTEANEDATRNRSAKILKIAGLFDIALGVVLVLAGPGWVPGVDPYWWFAGIVVAAMGVVLMLYARHLQRRFGGGPTVSR